MVMPSDSDYIETKQILLGKAAMKAEFRPLADWIDAFFEVKTINIIYDTIENSNRPRLQICFEYERERAMFRDSSTYLFDKKKQQQIGEQFKQTLEEQGLMKKQGLFSWKGRAIGQPYQTDNIWVVFGAFEPVAKMEANQSIGKGAIEQLKAELDHRDLWEIVSFSSAVVFFVFTDQQVRQLENSETRRLWTERYFDLLAKQDEFGYFKRDEFNIQLDSKENFDNNYQGNWYYYFK